MARDTGSWRQGQWGDSQAEGTQRGTTFSSALNTEIRGFNAPTHPAPKPKDSEEGEGGSTREKDEWLAVLRFLSRKA